MDCVYSFSPYLLNCVCLYLGGLGGGIGATSQAGLGGGLKLGGGLGGGLGPIGGLGGGM